MEYLSHSPEETERIGEELGRTLQLRYTPELQFIGDDSIQHGAHILELLRQVERETPISTEEEE